MPGISEAPASEVFLARTPMNRMKLEKNSPRGTSSRKHNSRTPGLVMADRSREAPAGAPVRCDAARPRTTAMERPMLARLSRAATSPMTKM